MLYSYQQFLQQYKNASAYSQTTFDTLVQNITNVEFPCYYAKTTLTKNSLYVAFIEEFSSEKEMFEQCKIAFDQFAEIEKIPNPYHVFVLSVALNTQNWEEDNALMWRFMSYLRQHDSEPWAKEIPESTENADWSFSYQAMPWFFNLNSHNNTHRKSRNVTNTFSFILQRTDGFEKLLKEELDETQRENQRMVIRKDIRNRVGKYDGQPVSPALAGESDNEEHLEWKQFHIPNLNSQKPQSKCPFHKFFNL
jgi:FPC/CPF motif-containing protein YcgG